MKCRWLVGLSAWLLLHGMLAVCCFGAGPWDGANARLQDKIDKKVTLTFQGMDLQEALRVVAEQGAIDIVVGASVKGTISASLNDVRVADALTTLCEIGGAAIEAQGEIVTVISEEEYARGTGRSFRHPLVLHRYVLRYAPVSAVLQSISDLGIASPAGRGSAEKDENAFTLSDIASAHARVESLLAVVDQPPDLGVETIPLRYVGTDSLLQAVRANLTQGVGRAELIAGKTLLQISDVPHRIAVIKDLMQKVDVPRRQVLIEVKILQVSYGEDTSFGVNWEVVEEKLNHLGIESAYPALPRTEGGGVASGTVLTFGDLADKNFEAVIEALGSEGKTDIVSLPRMLATSGREALIHVGSSEPIVTVESRESQGVINRFEKVTQVDVGVKLSITPTIHPNDFVGLHVRPEVSSVTRFVTTPGGSVLPVVDQSTLETRVLVKSGAHVVLGGLMKTERREDRKYVPLLGRIPLLGHLFGSTSWHDVRTELVVMIRPRIVTGDGQGADGVEREAGQD